MIAGNIILNQKRLIISTMQFLKENHPGEDSFRVLQRTNIASTSTQSLSVFRTFHQRLNRSRRLSTSGRARASPESTSRMKKHSRSQRSQRSRRRGALRLCTLTTTPSSSPALTMTYQVWSFHPILFIYRVS